MSSEFGRFLGGFRKNESLKTNPPDKAVLPERTMIAYFGTNFTTLGRSEGINKNSLPKMLRGLAGFATKKFGVSCSVEQARISVGDDIVNFRYKVLLRRKYDVPSKGKFEVAAVVNRNGKSITLLWQKGSLDFQNC